ncbi:LOW QUALITY PROTEIN: endothelial cell-specific molecule 1 [Phyllopteryx taeniolatus]|uniref:LOW QUALITY PROTEIN: endothelial cell-specific molecule 1 n=1 Tax=Phyllopteryx taeniolatus TaxID=161469 RepID=UPI002AD2E4A0|nr:LOW QUALITY PROTEIN: endothelial cell-specific molecule 1 [Phyllopteryx taeniolatus]
MLASSLTRVPRRGARPPPQPLIITTTTTTTTTSSSATPVMSLLLVTVLSTLLAHDAQAWGSSVKYAVNCPDRCDTGRCGPTLACARTVLDDCGCCRVCAAGRGEHCYRTVSGMHGVKCGPGLFCEFYKDEDDYGDEYGVCKDCHFGTYGMECRKICGCKGGLCDRETGACLTLRFFTKLASKLKAEPQDGEEGSGDVQESDPPAVNISSTPKRLNPR